MASGQILSESLSEDSLLGFFTRHLKTESVKYKYSVGMEETMGEEWGVYSNTKHSPSGEHRLDEN